MIDSKNWRRITNVIATAQRASMHCSIATVDPNGQPNITPIGTVFLGMINPFFPLILTPNRFSKIFHIILKPVYRR